MTESIKPSKRTRPSFDMAESMKNLVEASNSATDDRFAIAKKIVEEQPNVLSQTQTDKTLVNPRNGEEIINHRINFSTYIEGNTYSIPIDLIDSNPHGARVFYRIEDIEDIGKSMKESGQFVAVNGYVKGSRIELFDGETRLRGARAYGISNLQVKIESAPKDALEQYTRSALLNNKRKNHNCLDVAVRMKRLLEEGAFESQDALSAGFTDEKGKSVSKSQVSMYMRIARIPDRFLQKMSHADHSCTFTVAYELSGIFSLSEYASNSEKYNAIANEVIEEIQSKELGKEQSKNLITSKIQGKQSRLRADVTSIKYGSSKGTLKVFIERGQVDLSFKGLSETGVEELRALIERMLTEQSSK